ncbi:MAG TPA: endonuclease/exonuclease/phosphatase family protein [Bacteroidota bacterium]|nr:endonuclease/exonuclease/phosphatase family protein [Bacteroidota bacterium]
MIGRSFRLAATALAALLYIVVGVVVLASLLDHLDLLPPDSALFGIDFVPPLWFLPLVIPALGFAWAVRRRVAAAILAGMYLFLVAGFGDMSLPSFQGVARAGAGPRKLTVVALNVRYYSYGLERVLREVKDTDADLALLSENVLTEEERLYAEKTFAPSSFRMDHQDGTALVSRYPIVSYVEVPFPTHEASLSGGNDIDSMDAHPHRSFSHAVIDVNGLMVNAIAVRFIAGRPKDHSLKENLKWGRYLLDAQKQESEFFVEYLSRLRGPVIFGGDLNAPPQSKTMRKIQHIARDAQSEHNFWGGFTFRTEFPTLRIDYLFGMNGAESVVARRLDVKVSDHFPVYAEFSLSSPSLSNVRAAEK